jgi:hypothetical protein
VSQEPPADATPATNASASLEPKQTLELDDEHVSTERVGSPKSRRSTPLGTDETFGGGTARPQISAVPPRCPQRKRNNFVG